MKLNISIVTYHNKLSEIIDLVEQLLKNNCVKENNIYIVDNSINNELEKIIKTFDNINYIFNNSNLGYGKAHNIAIKNSFRQSIKYHLVINPDVQIKENLLDDILSFIDSDEKIGLLSPKILYEDGAFQNVYKLIPAPFDLIIRRFLPKSFFNSAKNQYELKSLDFNKILNIPNISGCFMFIRLEALKQVGVFDERYFMYLEDVDLSRRINKKFKTIYNPNFTITHGFKKESYMNYKLLLIHISSAIKYFNKWGWFFDLERKQINKNTLNQ